MPCKCCKSPSCRLHAAFTRQQLLLQHTIYHNWVLSLPMSLPLWAAHAPMRWCCCRDGPCRVRVSASFALMCVCMCRFWAHFLWPCNLAYQHLDRAWAWCIAPNGPQQFNIRKNVYPDFVLLAPGDKKVLLLGEGKVSPAQKQKGCSARSNLQAVHTGPLTGLGLAAPHVACVLGFTARWMRCNSGAPALPVHEPPHASQACVLQLPLMQLHSTLHGSPGHLPPPPSDPVPQAVEAHAAVHAHTHTHTGGPPGPASGLGAAAGLQGRSHRALLQLCNYVNVAASAHGSLSLVTSLAHVRSVHVHVCV